MNLRELRKAKKITQLQLSFRTGLSQSFISSIERGIKKPGLDNLKLISKALHITVDELIEDPDEKAMEG